MEKKKGIFFLIVLRSVCSCAESTGVSVLLRFLVPLQEVRMFNSYRTPPLLVFISSNELFGMKTSGWDEDTDSSGTGKLEMMKGKSTASKPLKYILHECSFVSLLLLTIGLNLNLNGRLVPV